MIPIDDKDKKKKEQQQTTTQPAQPAQPEQTTTTATTTEQPQQPQGPVPWEITTEEKSVNPAVYNLHMQNYEPRENAIQQHENSYLNKMSNIYGLINQNSEKTKEALKKQPIADAFNMLGTAVGKLSEVASNATFGGRVAPKKVDSSDIAKQGNALLKKSYELPQYLQAIDNDIIQNKAKQLQNEYAVNMNRLQRQMQYIQNAIEQSTDKTKIKYLSQEAYNLKQQELDAEENYKKALLELRKEGNEIRKWGISTEANKQDLGFDKLYVGNVPYPVEEGFIYDILNNSDLFTDEAKERLQGASYATIRGEIQTQLNKGKRPQYYKNKDIKVTQKIPFPFMETLRGQGKKMITNY